MPCLSLQKRVEHFLYVLEFNKYTRVINGRDYGGNLVISKTGSCNLPDTFQCQTENPPELKNRIPESTSESDKKI